MEENTETAEADTKAAEEENAEGTGPDTEAGTAAAEEYREGEVIISYYQSAISVYSAKSQMLLGPGMEIEDTCVFEDAGKLDDMGISKANVAETEFGKFVPAFRLIL